MLIKNYTYDPNSPCGTLHIIEDITDIVVHMNCFSGPENGPRFEGTAMPVVWVEHGPPTENFYFVDYTDKHGTRTRLRVTAYAYICNDQGKTVDKVGTNR